MIRGALRLFASWLPLVLGCTTPALREELRTPYEPDRRDYASFRAAHPDLLDPNYLPFMVHRFASDDPEGDLLVFCRWSDDAMPLSVYVETPTIPDSIQFEFGPRRPEDYVAAVEEAFEMWERELEGLVTFEGAPTRAQADLEVLLLPEVAPHASDKKVLGMIRLRDACRSAGWDPDAERLEVSFDVPDLRIYMADDFGLFTSEQVKWIALHEIGHALGMRDHSPIPADLMYEMVRDAISLPGLSIEDVNSFVSLYQLPNGAVFGRVPSGARGSLGPPEPPSGPPQLALAPYVNARLGFEFRPPHGWLRVETSRGMVATDGLTWDYSASFQVIVERFDTVDEYLERYASFYRTHGRLRFFGQIDDVAGYPAVRAIFEGYRGDMLEEVTLIEVGDGRVVVIIADCPLEHAESYLPWFVETLDHLQIWSEKSGE